MAIAPERLDVPSKYFGGGIIVGVHATCSYDSLKIDMLGMPLMFAASSLGSDRSHDDSSFVLINSTLAQCTQFACCAGQWMGYDLAWRVDKRDVSPSDARHECRFFPPVVLEGSRSARLDWMRSILLCIYQRQ